MNNILLESTNQEYLDYIRNKLDLLNKESGFDKSKKSRSKYEPDLMDPFDAMGVAALKYMEEQKRKNSPNE